jgi:DNA-binding transcriptional regulator LsrR (DeoR family)
VRTNEQSRVLVGKIARLYYEHGLTHAEIADLHGLSRVKVTRLLADARRLGIVEIRVHSDAPPFGELESALVERYGLQRVWVAPDFGIDERRSANSLGLVGADCLAELVPPTHRVAVGLSSAVAASVEHLRGMPSSQVEVVPVAGSRAGRTSVANPGELALSLARAFDGVAYSLPAPLLASSPEAAEIIRHDHGVRAILEQAAAADLLVVGIGGAHRASEALLESLTQAEFSLLRDLGAVGDVSARFFDAAGDPVASAVDSRVIGLELRALRAIPTRVGIAGGPEKHLAIRAAVSAGLVTVLVTDSATATALLETEARIA